MWLDTCLRYSIPRRFSASSVLLGITKYEMNSYAEGKLLPRGVAGGMGFRPSIEEHSVRSIGQDKTGELPCFIFFTRGCII